MSIASQPRFRLANLPTPLMEAPRLREALGGPDRCPAIWIKRDDMTGLAFGGNKVRKLEFLVADAIRQNATVLISAGAVQSNHARATAAAARVAGMKCVLVLSTKVDEPPKAGNLLLDLLMDTDVRFVADAADKDAAMEEIAADLREQGERPYLIPVGGSNSVGMLGYAAATLELMTQCFEMGIEPSHLFYAAGSYGTQAGLTLGKKAFGATYQIQGIADSPENDDRRKRAIADAYRAAEMIGVNVTLNEAEFTADPAYFGSGYGAITDSGVRAIRLVAQTEAVILDPVYTGKAMAGLIDYIERGRIGPNETVIFVHTGGGPGLFARGDEVLAASSKPQATFD